MDSWLILPALRGYLCGDLRCTIDGPSANKQQLDPHWNPCILAYLAATGNHVYSWRKCLFCGAFVASPLTGQTTSLLRWPLPEPRYRVLYVCSHPIPYVSPLFRRLAQDPRLDLHVAYCTLGGAEAVHDPEFNTTVQWDVQLLDGFSWTEIPNKGNGGQGFFGLFNPGLWQFILKGKFDAVICFTGYIRASFWISFCACKFSRTAFLFGTDTFTVAAKDRRSWKPAAKRLFWPHLYRLADQTIVGSSPGRELMLSLGICPDHISVIPNAVDNEWWISQAAKVDRDAVRSSWGANANTSVVLFCAKLQPWKRPADLLRAFADVNDPNSLLVIAGEGPLRQSMEEETAHLGISDRVRFLGFVNQSQLPSIYVGADLMVLPSEYDAFGLVVNEAYCCGCPAIVSDVVGAAQDLVAPVEPALIYPCGDVSALTQILRNLLSRPERLRELGRASFQRILSWSHGDSVSTTLEAIRSALRHRASERRP
jgi:glycosyltransferase involved in cell wall biosynthesis